MRCGCEGVRLTKVEDRDRIRSFLTDNCIDGANKSVGFIHCYVLSLLLFTKVIFNIPLFIDIFRVGLFNVQNQINSR